MSVSARRRDAGVDGLRAVAMSMVFLYHVGLAVPFGPDWIKHLVAQLRVGVWVFFVLSGYLLYRPFALAHAGERRVDVRGYLRRRVLRIFPAYVAALVLLELVFHYDVLLQDGSRGGHLDSPGQWLIHLALLQNYWSTTQITHGLRQAWSLNVEVAFYAFLPVAAAVIARLARRLGWFRGELVGVGAFFAIAYVWQYYARETQVPLTVLPNFLEAFGVGALLAVFETRFDLAGARPRWYTAIGRRAGWCWLVALGVLATKSVFARREAYFSGHGPVAQVYYTVFAALLVASVVIAGRSSRIVRVLDHRVIAFLGVVSYGFFLWHLPVLDMVNWHGTAYESNALVRGATTAAISLAAATASWYVVERPLLRQVKGRVTRVVDRDEIRPRVI